MSQSSIRQAEVPKRDDDAVAEFKKNPSQRKNLIKKALL